MAGLTGTQVKRSRDTALGVAVRTLSLAYARAHRTSARTQRDVHFEVTVFPPGTLEIRRVQPASPTRTEIERALDEARAGSAARAERRLVGEEMLSADEFARLLGTTRVTVNEWRKRRLVLAIRGAKRGYKYPSWQIGPGGKPFAIIPRLYELLFDAPWIVYRFFLLSHAELGDATAEEALRDGRDREVLEAAAAMSDGCYDLPP